MECFSRGSSVSVDCEENDYPHGTRALVRGQPSGSVAGLSRLKLFDIRFKYCLCFRRKIKDVIFSLQSLIFTFTL